MHILEDELLDEDFIAAVTRRSKSTLADWRRKGTGPAFVRIGRTPRYPREDFSRWLQANRVDPTARA
ncbi:MULTISPECIES: helix-turn-helix domain-containing protein [Rhodopseudomonas]|uniref:helix-turn-helix transcriptional regulator n=1 Tax=Rhodopseudomonas faecalis TaxID=99655 RepID=UPI000C9F90B0